VACTCACCRILKGKRLSEYPGLRETCEGMLSKNIRSPLLLGVLIDMYQELGDHTHLSKAVEVREETSEAMSCSVCMCVCVCAIVLRYVSQHSGYHPQTVLELCWSEGQSSTRQSQHHLITLCVQCHYVMHIHRLSLPSCRASENTCMLLCGNK
jgi:hypothetical protein